jgi:hypothetical protein
MADPSHPVTRIALVRWMVRSALQRSDILCLGHEKFLVGEKAAFVPILDMIFTLDASLRPTAKEVLEHAVSRHLPATRYASPAHLRAGLRPA